MSSEQTSGEYIQHHLTNLTWGQHADGSWGIAHSTQEAAQMGFWAIHIDTMFFSLLTGAIFLLVFRLAAKHATSSCPGGLQNLAESMVEFVDKQVRESFNANSVLIAPLALTIFVWILLMNTLDLLPIDYGPQLAQLMGINHMRILPTADLNAPIGMAIAVFGLIIFYSLRIKGVVGFTKEMTLHPFGKWLLPFNLLLESITLVAKNFSLAMRLFANFYAAEMVFILIAGLIPFWAQWALQLPWLIYHLLVVPLQAFIFMILTVVYLGMAVETQEH